MLLKSSFLFSCIFSQASFLLSKHHLSETAFFQDLTFLKYLMKNMNILQPFCIRCHKNFENQLKIKKKEICKKIISIRAFSL